MNSLEKQVLTLSDKLDALHQVIERLDNKVTKAISSGCLEATQAYINSQENSASFQYHLKGRTSLNSEFEHKDVLADGVYSDINPQGGDKSLTPEIQIQRLTAQLTAAYNRIAALEEQLLLNRIH